jgi:DNA-binding MarR family transcriptional regulator
MVVDDLIPELVRYLHATLGVAVAPTPWADSGRLPLFLRDRYSFFTARLLGLSCLFMVDTDGREESPVTVRKHIDQVRARRAEPVIYVRDRIAAYNRKRLIEQKVPFIVPGNQMYLPILGIDLREHFPRLRAERPAFRPSTQAVLLHMLLHGANRLIPTEMAPKLGYSAMTMSRALDELESAGLAESNTVGRERRLHLAEPAQEVWKKAQPFLRTPVHSRHWIRLVQPHKLPGPLAGLSALAHYSMMAEPNNMVIAVRRQDWVQLRKSGTVLEDAMDEPDALNVEVWKYPPAVLSSDGVVDRLSLYLSLRETEDERVEAALDKMIGEVAW